MSEWNAKPIVRRDLDRPNEITIEVEFVEVEVNVDELLEALAEAGVLRPDDVTYFNGDGSNPRKYIRYLSTWEPVK